MNIYDAVMIVALLAILAVGSWVIDWLVDRRYR